MKWKPESPKQRLPLDRATMRGQREAMSLTLEESNEISKAGRETN